MGVCCAAKARNLHLLRHPAAGLLFALARAALIWAPKQSGTKDQAFEWLLRAVELGDRLAETHASLAWSNFNAYDWSGAERELKLATAARTSAAA